MRPNFMEYTRADGSTFIVGRSVNGRYGIVGVPGNYRLRREAVAAGYATDSSTERAT